MTPEKASEMRGFLVPTESYRSGHNSYHSRGPEKQKGKVISPECYGRYNRPENLPVPLLSLSHKVTRTSPLATHWPKWEVARPRQGISRQTWQWLTEWGCHRVLTKGSSFVGRTDAETEGSYFTVAEAVSIYASPICPL